MNGTSSTPSNRRLLILGIAGGILVLCVAVAVLIWTLLPRPGPAPPADNGVSDVGKVEPQPPPRRGGPIAVRRIEKLAEVKIEAQTGGEVATRDGLTIRFAPGALDRDRTIQIHAVSAPPPEVSVGILGTDEHTPLQMQRGWEVDLGPEAGLLPGEVEVSVPAPPPTTGEGRQPLVLTGWVHGGTWDFRPVQVRDDRLVFRTRHFSSFFTFSCHPAYPGTMVAAGLVYLVINRADELPQMFHEDAPFVGVPVPDIFQVRWSRRFFPGTTATAGFRDVPGYLKAREAILADFPRRPMTTSSETPQQWWDPELDKRCWEAARQFLLPEVVNATYDALVRANEYIVTQQGFTPLSETVPVYVTRTTDKTYYQNPLLQPGYIIVAPVDPKTGTLRAAEELNTVTLHELYHRYQNEFHTFGELTFLEATATLLEWEARDWYHRKGLQLKTNEVAQFLAFRYGLDGPSQSLISRNDAPPRYFGYGLAWFLHYMKDQRVAQGRSRPDGTDPKQPGFQKEFLAIWRLRGSLQKAIPYLARDDELQLARSWLDFAETHVLAGNPAKEGADTPYGKRYNCAPMNYPPWQAYEEEVGSHPNLELPSAVLLMNKEHYIELGNDRVPPWSIQYFQVTVEKPLGEYQVVLHVPSEWFAGHPGRAVYLRESADAPLRCLARAGAYLPAGATPAAVESVWLTLSVSPERPAYLYVVDTGLGRKGGAPPALVFAMVEPSFMKVRHEEEAVSINWTQPRIYRAWPSELPAYTQGLTHFNVYVDGVLTRSVPVNDPAVLEDMNGLKFTRRDLGLAEYGGTFRIHVTSAVKTGETPDGKDVFIESKRSDGVDLTLPGKRKVTRKLETHRTWYDAEKTLPFEEYAFYYDANDDRVHHGTFKAWHRNGQLAVEGQYEEDKKEGVWRGWHDSGQQSSVATYSRGYLDGEAASWYSNGRYEARITYRNNLMEGKATYYHETGARAAEGEYRANKKEGEWTYWFDNYNLRECGTFKDGQRDGEWVEYHTNGVRAMEGTFRKGNMVSGTFSYYDEKGELLRKE